MRERSHAKTANLTGWFFVLALGLAAQVSGQAVSTPNQIVGTIEFTNTNPDILNIFRSPGVHQGFHLVHLTARSTVAPPLYNLTQFASASSNSTPYEITVEAGPPGAGIPYLVQVLMFLDQKDAGQGQDEYYFTGVISDPVIEENAPDAEAHFSECAGMLDVRWQTPEGLPVAVDGGSILAYRETSPDSGSFAFQARDPIVNAGSGQEYLAVHGTGSLYRVDISFDVGSDPFHDQTRFLHQAFVQVNCDEIVQVVCPVPVAGSTGQLGAITGELDILGEVENRTLDISLMRAVAGPFGNFRLDTIDVPSPSQGSFSLQNLVPSESVTPEAGYIVYADLSLRSGNRHQYFRTPALGGDNGRVFVSAGETKDLADTFVIDPGFVSGDVFLAGPSQELRALASKTWRESLASRIAETAGPTTASASVVLTSKPSVRRRKRWVPPKALSGVLHGLSLKVRSILILGWRPSRATTTWYSVGCCKRARCGARQACNWL